MINLNLKKKLKVSNFILLLFITVNCYAATEFVCTINKTGEDYNTLTLWEAAIDDAGNITAADCKVFTINASSTAFADAEAVTGQTSGATGTCIHQSGTQILIDAISGTFVAEQITGGVAGDITILNDGDSAVIVAECYDDDGALSDSVLISGGTTGAANYYEIRAPVGERHNGTDRGGASGTGFKLIHDADADDAIRVGSQYFNVKWIIIDNNGVNQDAISTVDGGSGYHGVLEQLVIHGTGTAYGLKFASGNDLVANNIIMYDVQRAAHASSSGSTTVKLNNWTVYGDGDYGILRAVVTNCYVGNFSTGDYLQATGDYNVASDTSSSGFTNNAQSKNDYSTYFTNVTGGNEDLHITNDDNSLWGLNGTDLSGTFTIDIDGDTRSTWDIGADEYITAGWTHDFYGVPNANISEINGIPIANIDQLDGI